MHGFRRYVDCIKELVLLHLAKIHINAFLYVCDQTSTRHVGAPGALGAHKGPCHRSQPVGRGAARRPGA